MNIATAISLIRTTISTLEIKATQENCEKMMSIHMLLGSIADAIKNAEGVKPDEDNNQQGSNVHGGMDCHTGAEHPQTDGAAADGPDHGAGGGGI